MYPDTTNKIYIDNQTPTSGGGSISGQSLYANTNSIFIGSLTNADTSNFYGRIDDVRFYNRALNISEISILFNEGN